VELKMGHMSKSGGVMWHIVCHIKKS